MGPRPELLATEWIAGLVAGLGASIFLGGLMLVWVVRLLIWMARRKVLTPDDSPPDPHDPWDRRRGRW